MAKAYTEDQLVEQPAIGLFVELGWQTVNDEKLLFNHKVGEAYFPRDRVPPQPLRVSCDRRKEIGPARISVSDRTISDKGALCQLAGGFQTGLDISSSLEYGGPGNRNRRS